MRSKEALGDTRSSERRTWIVIALAMTMMVGEILAGTLFNSMALLADGWHMGTHVAAFLVTALAYGLSRRYAASERFSFGTGKLRILGGFASAILLAVVALLMAVESAERLMHPLPIRFDEAILVASLGLGVNLLCAWVLNDGEGGHDHHHGGENEPKDLNRHAAYIHVLADALTSVTAIVALVVGKFVGWEWMDALMGILGSVVIGVWASGLVRQTSVILLDQTPKKSDLVKEIERAANAFGDRIIDLHVWQVSEGNYSAIVAVSSPNRTLPKAYREALNSCKELVHVIVEVNPEECAVMPPDR